MSSGHDGIDNDNECGDDDDALDLELRHWHFKVVPVDYCATIGEVWLEKGRCISSVVDRSPSSSSKVFFAPTIPLDNELCSQESDGDPWP